MKSTLAFRRISITGLLTIGFSFQNCYQCNCPKPQGAYFNITGLSADNFRQRGSCCGDKMMADEETALADHWLGVRYQLYYFSALRPQPAPPKVSLMHQAVACDCVTDGSLGSKERLRSFTVVTLHDFDSQHRANDTINDLLTITAFPDQIVDLADYLRTDTARIQTKDYVLRLKKRPELQPRFAARITIALQNGESYSTNTLPVIIQ